MGTITATAYGPPRPPAYYNGAVLSSYGLARVPRPPAAIPFNGNGRCIVGPRLRSLLLRSCCCGPTPPWRAMARVAPALVERS